MKLLKLRTTFIIVVLLILYGSFQWYKASENIVLSNGARLEWTPCWFKTPSQTTKHISCAYLFPSRSIRLPVVIIKQSFWNRQPSPILYLSGGPGYATGLAQEDIEFWLTWLDMNKWPHDLVLFDQRGTGLSQPQPNCPEVMSQVPEVLGQSLTLEKEFSLGKTAIEQCYKRLRENGIDLSSYNTLNSSRDVGNLMEALGGTDWNLYGVSYGTRLALSVVREYPERVRSVILDSVYPPEINELLETPFVYDNALATLFKGCAADEDCNSAFPNLEASFFTLLAQLRKAPIELMVSAPDSEKKLKVVINDHRFINMIFQALYRWDFIASLPVAIESAQRGNYEPLMPIVEDFVTWLLDTNFSDAVYMSVECYDGFPETTRNEFMAQVARFPRVREFVEKQWDYKFCRIWQVGRANDAFREPVSSDIPALFLAGKYDPVTPPVWAKKAAAHFSRGHVFVFPGIGHGAVDSDTCAPQLVREFLQNPLLKPQHECLSWLSTPDFVVDVE
ncbi:MAG: hypothetical protein DRR19_00480 [Candidatus Parabeggiatoa sp. nov. 1]|nr:MAG: hypothetical protein DRR19_00480 [Gammaproteobacteria bacterium]